MPPQVGPATNGFMQYDVKNALGSLIGRVVVTNETPTTIPQAAHRCVWSWTNNRVSFPDNFQLEFVSGGDGKSPGTHHWSFEGGPFEDPGSPPAAPETFNTHAIHRGGPSGPLVGHLWNKAGAQFWSGLKEEIDAYGMFTNREAGLYFLEVPTPQVDGSWRWFQSNA